MLIYPWTSALSDFRKQKLLQKLQLIDADITDVQAVYTHLVDAGPLSKTEDDRLRDLLTYGQEVSDTPPGELFLVIPRPGTISPWSTKATDIAHNSGLTDIKRIERATAYYFVGGRASNRSALGAALHDRMTESVLASIEEAAVLFVDEAPSQLQTIDILGGGKKALLVANVSHGFALAPDEINYLVRAYQDLGRNPTDVELMMFAQVNSEHCRHKIFNADWVVDGKKQPKSLFKMIKNTYEQGHDDVLSAYSDNAAVLRGASAGRFFASPSDHSYSYHQEPIHSVIKVETHNHPTAIAPIPGAATGIGGEIRDEAATGRGGKTKMGLSGFSVSNLNLPDAAQPWEQPYGKPDRIVSALDIMLDGPIGGAAYANEFGRPNLGGYFRTFEEQSGDERWGYHKPIMIAGGVGNIRDMHVEKNQLTDGAQLIVLGGPSMLIGLGGSAASSMQSGSSAADLDFASVQRANAEMERRCQEVIDACWALGDDNPIITIHDIGAGGLSNGLPELVHDSGLGASFELRNVPSAESKLSPMEIWCNESQERYVLGISKENLELFKQLCERERCPFAVVGQATKKEQLVLNDALFKNKPIDLPMSVLFGKPPKMTRTFTPTETTLPALSTEGIMLDDAIKRVMQLPAVGSKKFLITIGDRTVGGLVARDQMIGPWQVPVSDVAVTAAAFDTSTGEAMAMGERTPLAVIDAAASARIAIGEALTNIAAADIGKLSDIKLSANWMAAAGYGDQDEKLFQAVKTVGEEFCPALGLTIPVGKDSLSMRTAWQEDGADKSVTSPLSLIITAFSPVVEVEKTLTPQLVTDQETSLILIDLGHRKNRLGGSALAQVYNQIGNESPDVDPKTLQAFFANLQTLKKQGKVLAYHDRSDGGLLATISEMAFAARCGLDIDITKLVGTPLESLLSEELGAVIQVKKADEAAVLELLGEHTYAIGSPSSTNDIVVTHTEGVYTVGRAQLEQWWGNTSYQIQKLRDNPQTAQQEYAAISDDKDSGLSPVVTFKILDKQYTSKPKVAIFREQGVNGQIEMAAAFDRAGFTAVDVHLNDLVAGPASLDDFVGLAVCGGFSYGDVLGAGEGWAKSILFNDTLRTAFGDFFARTDTFSLGVCNGCQMLAALKELIPGAENWPTFQKNTSEQFEARVSMVQINESPSIMLTGMAGSFLPVPVAHGEGRANFQSDEQTRAVLKNNLVAAQYIDNNHKITEAYPANPNGSPLGITSLTTPDGRATILMPHPERSWMTRQLSWHPVDWDEHSPWFRIFQNARVWVDSQIENNTSK
ncbi:MAG: phosphoribosylformylglycinamidine synthase [Candidatus Saccharibacteria bacterium]|nr:phosphoribosylformylglycinamidine synthase [Candidatus Saccharibacteria bacterium]